ncbi:hypothetical protein OH77DRAFT_967250 [Trametes cingulata]|nr:hypothetical protein OH77DRAFT_967250 [Trametes cingulata]
MWPPLMRPVIEKTRCQSLDDAIPRGSLPRPVPGSDKREVLELRKACLAALPLFSPSLVSFQFVAMVSKATISAAFFVGATAFLSQVAASGMPRVPTTLLSPSHSWVFGVNSSTNLAARANGCPSGWAPCSSTTCYPLDGSECCSGTSMNNCGSLLLLMSRDISDGNFCPSGFECQSGGCCPFGKICSGSAGPPITIGGGDVPTDTDTFVPDPTTTHRATTTHPATAHPTTTLVTFNDPTDTDFGDSTFTSFTARVTSPTGAMAGTTDDEPIGTSAPQTTAGFPALGGGSGAGSTAANLWAGAMMSGMLAVFMIVGMSHWCSRVH